MKGSSGSLIETWRLRLHTLRRWDPLRRTLAWQAFWWLGWYRLLILTVGFRRFVWLHGWFMAETLRGAAPAQRYLASEIGFAVRRMADHTPWQSACLPQALAAQRMCRRRGLGSTLYLGMARSGDTEIEAHAWLRCGDAILTGEEEMGDFVQVASYALDVGVLFRERRVRLGPFIGDVSL